MSIRNCHIQGRYTPAGHQDTKRGFDIPRKDRQKTTYRVRDEKFRVLRSVPFGELVLFGGLFSDQETQRFWVFLRPEERVASNHATPSSHGVWPSGL